jgi:hypothetical protein
MGAAAQQAVSHAPVRVASTPAQLQLDGMAQPSCDPPEHLDVLFIGNSYMRMHEIPALVEELGEQAGIELDTEMLAVGGTDFEYHLAREQTVEALESRDWDVVILQSHSLDPIRNRDGFLEAGAELAQMVRKAGAEPVLFETWAREEGNELYRFGRVGFNPDEMQSIVHDGYEQLAQRTGASVIDVGAAWRSALQDAPELDLYASDSNHPGRLGSYLSAAVVFAALTDVSPVGNLQPLLDVDPGDAAVCCKHAAAIVQPPCKDV